VHSAEYILTCNTYNIQGIIYKISQIIYHTKALILITIQHYYYYILYNIKNIIKTHSTLLVFKIESVNNQ